MRDVRLFSCKPRRATAPRTKRGASHTSSNPTRTSTTIVMTWNGGHEPYERDVRPHLSCLYSPKCLEGEFSDVRLYGVLGSPDSPGNTRARWFGAYRTPSAFARVRGLCMIRLAQIERVEAKNFVS
jgi:hypothetical protein